MMKRTALFTLLALASTLMTPPATAQDVKRGLTKVTGDVYRAQSKFHFSLVVVTSAGVVVVDPINKGAATWLKANIGSITAKPITHLIYSHSHGDHASGGAALGAKTVVAHASAPASIDGVTPTMRFKTKKMLKVGNKSFEMTYLGKGHGTDLIAVVVRPENVGFIVDAAAPRRLPYRNFPHADIDAWIDQIRTIESLDFEIFAPGHGNIGKKADATDARIYMQKMRWLVAEGLKAGKSIDELVNSVTMDEYRGWSQYKAWRALNVQGMAAYLQAK